MTMAKYIDKSELYKEIAELEELSRKRVVDTPTNSPAYARYVAQLDERTMLKHKIADTHAADVAPVVHGKWISVENPQWRAYSHDKCSICGWWNTKNALCYDGIRKPGHSLNYCPNCGAKMDGDR
jgi:hypothetical protein